MTQNKVTDKSKDKEYFTITPQLVWALSRTPYDLALWNVVKMVAGDDSECILSTPDLATLAMMSTGKVSDCRKYLLESKLLEGELRRDPGYPQPVWHLTVPDLWPANLEWRQEIGHKLKDRIKYKREQQKSFHQVKPSPGEKGIIPGEEGSTPGEKGISPNETKDIHKDIQTEIQKGKPTKFPKKDAVVQAIIEQTETHPGPCDLARITEEKQAEKGNYAVPAPAGGSFALGDLLTAAACTRLGRSEPKGKKHDHALAFFEKALKAEGLLQGDIATLTRAVRDWLDPEGEYGFFLPQYDLNPKHELALRHFGIVLSKAKKAAADDGDRHARDVEVAEASLAALDERRAARSPPPEDDEVGRGVKAQLEAQMGRNEFRQYVQPTCFTCDDGVLVITAPNTNKRNWLENRLGSIIKRALAGVAGGPGEVAFEITSQEVTDEHKNSVDGRDLEPRNRLFDGESRLP